MRFFGFAGRKPVVVFLRVTVTLTSDLVFKIIMSSGRILVLIGYRALAIAYLFWTGFFHPVTSTDVRNLTTLCDSHRCHDNPSGQHTNLAQDKLYNFMALIYELNHPNVRCLQFTRHCNVLKIDNLI